MKNRKTRILILSLCAAVIVAVVTAILLTVEVPYDITPHIDRSDEAITVTSPSGNTALTLTVADGRLTYAVTRDGKTFLKPSALGFTVGDTAYGTLSSLGTIGEITGDRLQETRPVNGRKAVADDACIQVFLPLDEAFTVEARVFDNGVAFRYRLSGDESKARQLQSEETSFCLPSGSKVWAGEAHIYYESINKYWAPDRYTTQLLGTPATVILEDGSYTAILEGNLRHYPGIKLRWDAKYRYGAEFDSGTAYKLKGDILSPWRIISVADDLNELVNNTILYQVCDEADSALFEGDWVIPGRATWSWITGRTTDAVTPDTIEAYTDYAAKLGFEYNIIDEGWLSWINYRSKLEKLADRGAAYDVRQILWSGVTAGESYGGGFDNADEAKAYLDFLKSVGMSGAKIDFFTTENNIENGVDIYEEILRYAAEQQLVINFHGCNKPTGLDATYPNELNREAILGLESTQVTNRKVQAQMFVTQPFVRNLAGHADFTPAVEDAFHMAQLVLTDAPMQAIGSDPRLILRSEALEMIKSVPTVWNRTVVLPQSAIGRSAVIAREGKNGSWYVGGINNIDDAEQLTLDLSRFLGDGTYRYELWTDGNKGLEKQTGTVTKEDTLIVPFAALEGFIVRFDQFTLSQYGGEIDGEVTLSLADSDTVVHYTTDGAEATDHSPAWPDGEALTFDESTTLRLWIRSPNGTYTASYRFNDL